MEALIYRGRRDLGVGEVAEPPEPRGDDVVVRPVLCGICGTDLHEYTDGPIVVPTSPHPLNGSRLPQILGHEFAARVEAVGPEVAGVAPGDLCAVMPLISCGRCDQCRQGANHRCRTMACTGLSSDWGGLAAMATVQARQLVPVPGSMTARQAALIEPTAVAAYGVDRSGMQAGETVLVTGAGPIGSLATMYALARGARRVVLVETDAERRGRGGRLGEGLGEVVTVDPASEPVVEVLADLTDGAGAAVAIECAGKEAALNVCIDAVRPGGTVVQTALHVRPATISAETLAVKDMALVGTWCYPVWDFPRLVALVSSGHLPVERVVTATVRLHDAVEQGFDLLTSGGNGQVKVLIEVAAP